MPPFTAGQSRWGQRGLHERGCWPVTLILRCDLTSAEEARGHRCRADRSTGASLSAPRTQSCSSPPSAAARGAHCREAPGEPSQACRFLPGLRQGRLCLPSPARPRMNPRSQRGPQCSAPGVGPSPLVTGLSSQGGPWGPPTRGRSPVPSGARLRASCLLQQCWARAQG